MAILLDTHVLVWALGAPGRLSPAARRQIVEPGETLFVSAVTAFDYADLHARGRLPAAAHLDRAIDALDITFLDAPAALWRLAEQLPQLHSDPVDRMLLAHALQADLTLVTADATMRRYPVRSLW